MNINDVNEPKQKKTKKKTATKYILYYNCSFHIVIVVVVFVIFCK